MTFCIDDKPVRHRLLTEAEMGRIGVKPSEDRMYVALLSDEEVGRDRISISLPHGIGRTWSKEAIEPRSNP